MIPTTPAPTFSTAFLIPAAAFEVDEGAAVEVLMRVAEDIVVDVVGLSKLDVMEEEEGATLETVVEEGMTDEEVVVVVEVDESVVDVVVSVEVEEEAVVVVIGIATVDTTAGALNRVLIQNKLVFDCVDTKRTSTRDVRV